MSQSEYIQVDSIHDIDPNKLSLSYVGKKFIDKENNRFSIRFNKETRKMEIVRLVVRQPNKPEEENTTKNPESITKPTPSKPTNQKAPTPERETKIEPSSPKETKLETPPPSTNSPQEPTPKTTLNPTISKNPSSGTKPTWNLKNYDLDFTEKENPKEEENIPSSQESPKPTKPELDPIQEKWKDKTERDKIDNFLKRIEEAKARINAALVNIKSSRIFEITGDPSENQNIIGNLTREFDVEVFQHIEAATNYLKELTFYPRAINYYTAKFERTKRKELANADDKQKLHLVIRWEMQEAFTKICENLKALTISLLEVLNMKKESQIKQLQYMNQMLFRNAKDATFYVFQDVEKLIQELEDWKYETASVNDELEPKRNNRNPK